MMEGLVQIYTGNGKGKTTAALGLGIRAYGCGLKVLLVRFLKGSNSGELELLQTLGTNFEVRSSNTNKFTNNMNAEELGDTKQAQQELLDYVMAVCLRGEKDLIILDEVMAAIHHDFLALKTVTQFIQEKPNNVELVLTGRNAPPELIALADYVSEIQAVKHPFTKGIPARCGIEY